MSIFCYVKLTWNTSSSPLVAAGCWLTLSPYSTSSCLNWTYSTCHPSSEHGDHITFQQPSSYNMASTQPLSSLLVLHRMLSLILFPCFQLQSGGISTACKMPQQNLAHFNSFQPQETSLCFITCLTGFWSRPAGKRG